MSPLLSFQPPAGRVEVLTRRASGIAMIILLLIFGGIAAVMLLSSHINNARYLLIPLSLGLLLIISFLVIRARRNSVRCFDAGGVTRGDGRHFPWGDFEGVVKRWSSTRYGGKSVWRIELNFRDGQAWILPSRIRNLREVLDYVQLLPEAGAKG